MDCMSSYCTDFKIPWGILMTLILLPNLKKYFCVIWCLCSTEIVFPSISFSHPESLQILHPTSSICSQCCFLYPPSKPSGKGLLLGRCGTILLPKYFTFVLPDMPSKCDIRLLHLWDVWVLLEHRILILQVALRFWHCTLIGHHQWELLFNSWTTHLLWNRHAAFSRMHAEKCWIF
jgi:hypothetical protein